MGGGSVTSLGRSVPVMVEHRRSPSGRGALVLALREHEEA